MSRFSRSEAEARGWKIVHESPAETVLTSETQGETRRVAASYRAEKVLAGGGMLNEEAESVGKLLERIYEYEHQLELKGIEQVAVPINEANIPLNEEELPIRHVTLPGGEQITEEELVSRSKSDAIYTEEGMVFHGPLAEVIEADEARQEAKREGENERAAHEDVGPVKQIHIDNSQIVVDTPGGATGSVLIVREDEDELSVQDRRIAEKTEAEANKSLVAPVPESEVPVEAPEEEEAEEEASDGDVDASDEESIEAQEAPSAEADEAE